MSELRNRILAWLTKLGGDTLPPREANRLADRLYEMAVGWLQAAPSEEDAFLAKYKAKLISEFAPQRVSTDYSRHYNANCLCVHCKHMRPALDPNIQKAYLGKCMKREWPFTLAITLQGWTECDVFEESGQKYVPPDPMAAKAVAAAAGPKGPKRVEFYYSSTQKPGETFPCDINHALELVKQLQSAGVEAKAIDVAGIKDRFPIYHKAVSGPDASVRPVFGFKGALIEDFGTTVPALLVFEGDRYPTLAFPRTDFRRGTIRVEQALSGLIEETTPAWARAVSSEAE